MDLITIRALIVLALIIEAGVYTFIRERRQHRRDLECLRTGYGRSWAKRG